MKSLKYIIVLFYVIGFAAFVGSSEVHIDTDDPTQCYNICLGKGMTWVKNVPYYSVKGVQYYCLCAEKEQQAAHNKMPT
jgi:hypothetical protein